jgi:aspartate carbamoyltransferase catalytic subunit
MEFRAAFEQGRKFHPSLEGAMVLNLFFEPSTRTRVSFESAEKYLGAQVINLNPQESSSRKGESEEDTLHCVAGYHPDLMVIRHVEDGFPRRAQELTGIPVINAGDGRSCHPTQALLDILTLRERFGDLDGRKILFLGNLSHSRVVNSTSRLAEIFGMRCLYCSPPGWEKEGVPPDSIVRTPDSLEGFDAVYVLRIQFERGAGNSFSEDEYVRDYRLDEKRVGTMDDHAVIMHPAPMNRGVEITDGAADCGRSLIFRQMENGLFARMALLEKLWLEGR